MRAGIVGAGIELVVESIDGRASATFSAGANMRCRLLPSVIAACGVDGDVTFDVAWSSTARSADAGVFVKLG